jgi:hypothetical protein
VADAPDVQYEQAAGTPDQMPQGQASELNAGLPTENPTAPAPIPIAFPSESEDTAGQPQFAPSPGSDVEQILFGEPDGTEPTTPELPPGRLPDSVVRWLATMKSAANEPTSPDSLRAIYTAAVNSLDAELRA